MACIFKNHFQLYLPVNYCIYKVSQPEIFFLLKAPENDIFVSKQSKNMNFSLNLPENVASSSKFSTKKQYSSLKQIENMIFSSMQAQNLISSSKQPENEPQLSLMIIFSSKQCKDMILS